MTSSQMFEYAPECYWSLNQPWDIIITPHTYNTIKYHKQFADRVMAEYGWTADQVCEIRGREGLIEVDQPTLLFDGRDVITCTIMPLNAVYDDGNHSSILHRFDSI